MTEDDPYMPPGKRFPVVQQIGTAEIIRRQEVYREARAEWRRIHNIPSKFSRG